LVGFRQLHFVLPPSLRPHFANAHRPQSVARGAGSFLAVGCFAGATIANLCNLQELFLCSKNLNIDTPIFCDYNLVEKHVEIYNFGD